MNHFQMIQYFANEYCKPKSIVLIIGTFEGIENVKNIFTFINSDVIIVDTIRGPNVDIVINNNLPFESHSFDLIINSKNIDVIDILKPDGKLLLKSELTESYTIDNQIFNILRSNSV